MLPFVVNQYNSTPHTTPRVSPDDAAKLEWDASGGRDAIHDIRDTISDKAHYELKHPTIAVGDLVQMLRKPGNTVISKAISWHGLKQRFVSRR